MRLLVESQSVKREKSLNALIHLLVPQFILNFSKHRIPTSLDDVSLIWTNQIVRFGGMPFIAMHSVFEDI
jgi:hypothetical protein